MESIFSNFNPSLIVAVIGWWVLHNFSISRDRSKQRHDLKIRYLIDVYRALEAASHCELTPEKAKTLENAISDIQLFGSKEQVDLAKSFSRDFAEKKSGALDALLFNLRNDLRRELGLVEVTKISHLRVLK